MGTYPSRSLPLSAYQCLIKPSLFISFESRVSTIWRWQTSCSCDFIEIPTAFVRIDIVYLSGPSRNLSTNLLIIIHEPYCVHSIHLPLTRSRPADSRLSQSTSSGSSIDTLPALLDRTLPSPRTNIFIRLEKARTWQAFPSVLVLARKSFGAQNVSSLLHTALYTPNRLRSNPRFRRLPCLPELPLSLSWGHNLKGTMHYAYPPRKDSHPAPFRPRRSRLPMVRRSQLKTILLFILAIVGLVWLFSGSKPSGPRPITGKPLVVVVTVFDDKYDNTAYSQHIKDNRIQYAEKHGKIAICSSRNNPNNTF